MRDIDCSDPELPKSPGGDGGMDAAGTMTLYNMAADMTRAPSRR